jgi:O-antigen/teichoic acid export membrane protein
VTSTDVLTPEQAGGRAALRDGTALSVSAMLTGVVGLVCWVVAAALLPQEAVGGAAAFVSGFILVAGIAQLNIGLGMLRWLPGAGNRTGALVLRGYAVVAGVAVAGALVFLALPAGDVIRHAAPDAGQALFVGACLCWALFQLQDPVLAALGRAWWVPMFNGAYGAIRVITLPLLGSAFGALGVLISWIAPTAATMAAAGLVITMLVLRRNRSEPAELPSRREVLTFLGPTYLASLATTLLYNSVPLLVVHYYGTALGATFFVIWTGVNAADYAISGFVNSLVLRGSAQPGALPEILRAVASRLSIAVFSGVAAGIALAPLLLGLFGQSYADQGGAALRVLLAGMAIRLVVALGIGLRLAEGDGRGAAAIQMSSTVLVLLGVVCAPVSAGLTGPALGFLLAQAVVAAAVWPALARRLRQRIVPPPEPEPKGVV